MCLIRALESSVRIADAVFTERTADTEDSIARVVALFGMYTFFSTQPSTSLPPVHSLPHIAIPIGTCHRLFFLISY